MGSGTACFATSYFLQNHIPIGGLILQGAFKSVSEVAGDTLAIFRYLFTGIWNNVEEMKFITCPVLLMHTACDSTIALEHSQRLCDACVSDKKHLAVIDYGDHNTIRVEDRVEHIRQFLNENFLNNHQRLPLPSLYLDEKYWTAPESVSQPAVDTTTGGLFSNLLGLSTASVNVVSSSLRWTRSSLSS
ncbi:unnamed protein product [Didymodactylos carnosus]|uniref:Uncharacterized protein n=1 Tax=Didymodactylos carnosus TaxID=1234261 RepID=A0A8S2GMH5_9BILA|nr:unnamed protein product [Didymodactylos carnosus]CAF3536965.1 unnamed protein product [Didymodactylos carnosus]